MPVGVGATTAPNPPNPGLPSPRTLGLSVPCRWRLAALGPARFALQGAHLSLQPITLLPQLVPLRLCCPGKSSVQVPLGRLRGQCPHPPRVRLLLLLQPMGHILRDQLASRSGSNNNNNDSYGAARARGLGGGGGACVSGVGLGGSSLPPGRAWRRGRSMTECHGRLPRPPRRRQRRQPPPASPSSPYPHGRAWPATPRRPTRHSAPPTNHQCQLHKPCSQSPLPPCHLRLHPPLPADHSIGKHAHQNVPLRQPGAPLHKDGAKERNVQCPCTPWASIASSHNVET